MTSLPDNYTVQDVFGALRGVAGFALVLFFPGYLFAAASNLFHFKGRSPLERAAWAIALSFAISPILLSLGSHVTGFNSLALLFSGFALTSLVLVALEKERRPIKLQRNSWAVLILLLGGALLDSAARGSPAGHRGARRPSARKQDLSERDGRGSSLSCGFH